MTQSKDLESTYSEKVRDNKDNKEKGNTHPFTSSAVTCETASQTLWYPPILQGNWQNTLRNPACPGVSKNSKPPLCSSPCDISNYLCGWKDNPQDLLNAGLTQIALLNILK